MKSHRGMTLIEFIMTIAVGSFLVAGIVLFTRQEISNGATLRDFLIASNLARLEMAQINNLPYPSVGTTNPTGEASFPGFIFQRVVSNVAINGSISLRRIELLVDKSGGSFATPLVRLITYRQSQTTFGDGA